MDYATCCDIPEVSTAENEHDRLKYQAIQIGTAWESNKMTLYTKLNACWLDGEGWALIKAYGTHKDDWQDSVNLREYYESDGEVNKRVAWEMSNIDNSHFTSKLTYSLNNLSTVLQYDITILNKNGEKHSENQMVRKMVEKIKLHNST